MFEWLNNLGVGDSVVIRDSSHLITCDPAPEFVEVVIELTDEHIKTERLDYERPPVLAAFRRFERRFGSSGAVQLVRNLSRPLYT